MHNPKKAGLVLGVMFGGIHILWSLLVLLGLAQWFVDFVMWAHMVESNVVVESFDIIATLTLIVVASAIGFVVGFVGAHVWNHMHHS